MHGSRPGSSFAILVALLMGAASGQAGAAPEPAMQERIAKVFAEYDGVDRPGCAVGIMRDGQLIYGAGYGAADLAARTPIDARTLFNIASVSKQFTAFAVLQLQERGALSLDDPITKHVPELGAYARSVTLRHLLHHVGGLRAYETLLLMRGHDLTEKTTSQQALQLLSRQAAANSAPGVEYDYSNTGYFLLGLTVERVSGKSLAEYSRQHLFAPLKMTQTTLIERFPTGLPTMARPYLEDDGRFKDEEWIWEQTGDGQIYTNVEDLARWEANFHGPAVGSAELLRKLHEPAVLDSGHRLEYAAGVAVRSYRGLRTVRHGGDWGGYRAHLLRFPDQGFAVSVLCNRSDARPFRRAAAVAELYLGDLMAPSDVSPYIRELVARGPGVDPRHLQAGLYRNPETGAYVRLERDSDTVRLDVAGERSTVAEVAPGVYLLSELGDMYALFTRAAARSPAQIVLQDSPQPYRYEYVAPWKPRRLKRYVGSYWSAEVDVGYSVQERDGALVLDTGSSTVLLRPAAQNEFVGEGLLDDDAERFTLRFDASGRAFRLFVSGLRGLEFKRRD